MPDELTRFQTVGLSWAERARMGELNAVLSPIGTERRNRFLHSINMVGARAALELGPRKGVLLDFGCGTGRFIRFFGGRGYYVVGTEITREMLLESQRFGLPARSAVLLTDGVSIPVRDQSLDMIWCCGVLRFSLFVMNSVYQEIAKEMYRVLKPGGLVVNIEMYVDAPPEIFTRDFEHVGFETTDQRILQRYEGRIERLCQSRYLPLPLVICGAKLSALYRFWFDSVIRPTAGLRDYLFVWCKPRA